jgi:hypothetical protein
MKNMNRLKRASLLVFVLVFMTAPTAPVRPASQVSAANRQDRTDPLPAWHDNQVKERIIAFVKRVTDKHSAYYVPPQDRIATFAAGNVRSGGDIGMLTYCQGRKGASFQLLVNHDDAKREFAYAEPKGESLKAAADQGWNVVSMRDDWRQVFAFEEKAK